MNALGSIFSIRQKLFTSYNHLQIQHISQYQTNPIQKLKRHRSFKRSTEPSLLLSSINITTNPSPSIIYKKAPTNPARPMIKPPLTDKCSPVFFPVVVAAAAPLEVAVCTNPPAELLTGVPVVAVVAAGTVEETGAETMLVVEEV